MPLPHPSPDTPEAALWVCVPTRKTRYVVPRQLSALQALLRLTELSPADLDYSDPEAIHELRRHLILLSVVEDRRRLAGEAEGPLACFTRRLLRVSHGSCLHA